VFSTRTNWKLALNRFTEAQREFAGAGREVLDLTISNPTRAGLRYDEAAILDALRNPQSLDYDPQPKGLLSAREAVASYYKERGETISPDSLLLTTSTSEGYSYLFRLLCNPGDEVLVPKPSYPLFEFLADLQDVKLIPYPLIYDHGWLVDIASLRKSASERPRAVVVVHPNNPTGSYASAQERKELNRFCREHEAALIVDEVFLDYPLEGKHDSFVTNADALTFTLSGISKISGLPQMKMAWIAASGPQHEKDSALERLEVIADTYLSMNAPVQLAAPALLDARKTIQSQLQGRVRANLAELDRRLASQKNCARLKVEGGWYAVLRVPVTRSDEELAIALLRECSVLVHPGHFYDFANDGYLVLSLITAEEEFRRGVEQTLAMLNS
jgi:alanine-synthesizing transaminase